MDRTCQTSATSDDGFKCYVTYDSPLKFDSGSSADGAPGRPEEHFSTSLPQIIENAALFADSVTFDLDTCRPVSKSYGIYIQVDAKYFVSKDSMHSY